MMRCVLDAMGSDAHPEPEVRGAVKASLEMDIEVILVGQEELISPLLDRIRKEISNGEKARVRVVHAAEVISMTDKPAENARRKAQNSMAVGLDLLRSQEADAFVTAGNTGGAMVNALFHLGRIRGIKRPALTALFPTKDGGRTVVLDIGANAVCKPDFLLQFAIMGDIYARKALGVSNPRIGLLSNGEEEGKGTDLIKETYNLLSKSGLNFQGNVEPKELFAGMVDVAITDGFTGNMMVKSSEAVLKLLTDTLKNGFKRSFATKIGALLARPVFMELKKILSAAEVGAVPLLGIDGLVFVGHGRSESQDIVNAIAAALISYQSGLLDAMREAIQGQIGSVKSEMDAQS